jgi:hypothetical protein
MRQVDIRRTDVRGLLLVGLHRGIRRATEVEQDVDRVGEVLVRRVAQRG